MLLEKIGNAVLEGDDEVVCELVEKALAEGTKPLDVLEQGLVPGMDEVGKLFKTGEMFVPEVLMAANAMQAGNDILEAAHGWRNPRNERKNHHRHSKRRLA